MTGKIIVKCEHLTGITMYDTVFLTENENGYYFTGIKNDNTIFTKKFKYLYDAYCFMADEINPENSIPFNN